MPENDTSFSSSFDSVEAAIAAVDLFSELEPEARSRMAATASFMRVQAKTQLFEAGSEALGFYAVLQGRVRLYQMSPTGKEHTIHAPGPGDVFAEAAVFKGRNYPASAQALEDSLLLFFDRHKLRRAIAADPDLAFAMLGLLAQRMRLLVSKLEAITLKEVPARLAGHLLLLAASQRIEQNGELPEPSTTVTLNLAKGHLATLLGATPETLSRALKSLASQELIEIKGRKITLLDPEGLEEVAEGLV